MVTQRNREQGFTLIEMIVTVAIIASLAAILVPIVSSELGDTAQSRAIGDAQRIGTAMTQFIKDTRIFPTGPGGDDSVEILRGAGNDPAGGNAMIEGDGADENLLAYLTDGLANGGALWNGPYMQQIPADPWGNAFFVNVNGYYDNAEYVWVISAGPDGEIETLPEDVQLAGDDIGILID